MTTRWRRDPRVLWRRSGDRVVVLAEETDQPILLSGVGVLAWDLLDHPIVEQELYTVLGELFGLAEATVTEDVAPFLDELAAAGAVMKG